ncbi:hypothetical protein HMPREF9713_02685 [Myroides odoratimimus CCUG 12700]|uniref:heavy-metal-associated domain-containing protein n=1 Tax=Myroides odoratimimus TaxID=76832 RepID=UPI000352ACDB|nr:heavy-metal-associated domain-containing protein [Myroides odoratimimus]EPH09671.1 hypothetical protein HMPREF9713_02685 [Myroides odoratimimus CCUG 12700]
MKIVKSIGFMMLGAILLVSCKNEEKTADTSVSTASTEVAGNVEHTTFKIDGMTCEIGCAKLIEGKLAGLDGVKLAKVDFDTKTAEIDFDESKQSVESLVGTVEKIANGIYKVESVSATK